MEVNGRSLDLELHWLKRNLIRFSPQVGLLGALTTIFPRFPTQKRGFFRRQTRRRVGESEGYAFEFAPALSPPQPGRRA